MDFRKAALVGLCSGVIGLTRLASLPGAHATGTTETTAQESVGPKKIIWAGVSGLPPKYIDSGPNKGTGWLEVQTLAIRKLLERQGFQIQIEYFTPARIEHEFQSGSPICTYPDEWRDPKTLFEKKPDRIRSISLDLAGDSSASLLIPKRRMDLFRPYLDQKGDIDLTRLLTQSSLKTLIVRDAPYGPWIKQIVKTDPKTGDQIVEESLRKNVSILLIKDNRQLAEMLNADRFDYIFSDSIERESFEKSGLDPAQFATLNFETTSVKSIEDPSLVRISVACAPHPVTIAAMPWMNQQIKAMRSSEWSLKMALYRRKMDSKLASFNSDNFVSERFAQATTSGLIDHWYQKQAAYFPPLLEFPNPAAQNRRTQERNAQDKIRSGLEARPPLKWLLVEPSPGHWVSLTEADLALLSPSLRSPTHWEAYTIPYPLDRLADQIDSAFRQQILKAAEGSVTEFQNPSNVKSLTLFGLHQAPEGFARFKPYLHQTSLEKIAFLGGSADLTARLVEELLLNPPPNLVELNLSHSGTFKSRLPTLVRSLKKLKRLILPSSQISRSDFPELLKALPPNLESLSLGFHRSLWDQTSAASFSTLKLPALQSLDLENSGLDDALFRVIQKAIPSRIKYLNLGTNFLSYESLEFLFNGSLKKIKSLVLAHTFFVPEAPKLVKFPESLEELDIGYTNLTPVNTSRIFLPKKLTQLEAGQKWISSTPIGDAGAAQLLSQLSPSLKALGLAGTHAGDKALALLQGFAKLETLDLSANQLGRNTPALLNPLKGIRTLILRNNLIDNGTLLGFSSALLNSLQSLDLSENLISETSLTPTLSKLGSQLESLKLNALISIDTEALRRIPSHLTVLELADNNLGDAEIKALITRHVLSKENQRLKRLTLSHAALSPDLIHELTLNFPQLWNLQLDHINLTEVEAAKVLASLPNSLSSLSVGPLRLTQCEGPLHLPEGLTSLKFNGSAFSAPCSTSLFRALPRSTQELDFSNSNFDRGKFEASDLRLPDGLRSLTFSGVTAPAEFTYLLAKALPDSLEIFMIIGLPYGEDTNDFLDGNSLPNLFKFVVVAQQQRLAKPIKALQRPYGLLIIALVNALSDAFPLNSLEKTPLSNVKQIYFGNSKLQIEELRKVLSRISQNAYAVYLPSSGVDLNHLPKILSALPKRLHELVLSGNPYGQSGKDLIEKHAEEQLRKTGVPLYFDH